jgi:hypothetical protein
MANERPADLSLFIDILQTLEAMEAPYMIIGAFAATVYGITRVTYDIDMVVDLAGEHIQALADAYPPPRYYADPLQMRNSINMGIMFNIIDTERGEKADLIPLTMASPYRFAFQRRIQQTVDLPGTQRFDVWCARPEDVIVGKLLAWAEGRSRKHETDIYEMLVYQYLESGSRESSTLDTSYVDVEAQKIGAEVAELWEAIKAAAEEEAQRIHET